MSPPEYASAVKAARSHLCVLVVDDDPLVLAMNKQSLRRIGVRRIETADNGREALDVLAAMNEPPDVIITDLNMPGMDGVELLRHVADRRVGAGVIVASGEERRLLTIVHQLAIEHGLTVLGVMPKPLTYESLVKLLNDFSGTNTTPTSAAVAQISEREIDDGLTTGSLAVVFQPKVRQSDRRVVGAEALARWNHPQRGMLGPAAFIPLAEETGRIGALTNEMIRRSIIECGRWKAAGFDVPVSVNVTADDLADVALPDRVEASLKNSSLNATHLTLEVTESRIMRNLRATMETLTRLRMKGIGLSVDDFGTGYASLEQLKRAPFTEVKVDRAFVHGASDDPTSQAILEWSITLGRKLNMRVVAEGAETQADWDLLGALECEVVQGYFISPPMPATDMIGWLTNWSEGRK